MKRLLIVVVLAFVVIAAPVCAGAINSSVIFYMPANGTASETTFYDLSNNAYTITTSGDTKIKNANSSWRFNNASYFDGTDDRLTSSPMAANMSGDFTVAFWFNSTSATTWNGLVGNHNQSSAITGTWRIGTRTNAGNYLNLVNEGTLTGSSAANYNDGVWHYLVLIKNGTVLNMTVDGVYKINASAGAWKWGALSRDITLGHQAIDNIYYTGYLDDVVILNYAVFDPKLVPAVEFGDSGPLPPAGPILASFTQSTNPSTIGNSVNFNDTSTGIPTTWNWTISGTITNTTQNASYTFPAIGVYSVNLTVTNATGSISSSNQTHSVTNVSGFTPQDIWMEGQYLQTFHITDSATGLPIPVVDLQDTAMQTYTTTNGTGYLTEAFGASTVVFVSSGYNSKSVSYVFDSDESHSVQLTASTPGGSQNVWYTPWQVRFRIVDYYGAPLPGTNVTVNYIASTLPSTDVSWLIGAFGIDNDVAEAMVNSSLAMSGTTDDNGGLSFTMFKSIQYAFLITNTTSGVLSTKNIYPSDSEYVIYVRTAGQTANNNTLATRNATLPWYSVNSTHINLNMTYIDTSLCTSKLVFRVWFRDNGSEVHNTTWSGFGGNYVYDNHTIAKAPIGTEYLWGYNATTVC